MVALADSGADEGLWLRAGRQTGGRGRSGRIWTSESGNLHASTLVRLRPGDPPAHSLALVGAVAVYEAATTLLRGLDAHIKWPNDIMVGDAKLSGMLLERARDAVIVGFGMNVTHAPEIAGRATTSLASCGASADIDAGTVVECLASVFAHWVDRWRACGFAAIRAAWLEAALGEGTPLRATLPDGTVTQGRFAGLADDGALILQVADGMHRTIHAGDVFAI